MQLCLLIGLMAGCVEDAVHDQVDCTVNPNIVNLASDASPIHDPSIIKAGDRYFVYSSSALGSFYSSSDLMTWRAEGAVFSELPGWLVDKVPAADHIGSPDIHFYRGKYVLFYQSHKSNTCLAATGLASNVTLDPSHSDYAWQDHGLILNSTPHFEDVEVYCGSDEATFNAIDGHFFVDLDEAPYLVFGSTIGGIKAIALDAETLMPQADAQFYTLAERLLWQDDPIIEAPYLMWRDGYYYLFVSHNHCCRGADTRYQVRVGRSQNLTGPYYDRQGRALTDGGGTLLISGDGEYIGTGHADVLEQPGQDWLVHHSKDPGQDYRAYLNIRRINWAGDVGDRWPTLCVQ